jgi:DNA-binding NarL/FixJ family response regulator
MTKKIRVLLVDDHGLVRRGFRRMLEDEAGYAKWPAKPAMEKKP